MQQTNRIQYLANRVQVLTEQLSELCCMFHTCVKDSRDRHGVAVLTIKKLKSTVIIQVRNAKRSAIMAHDSARDATKK